VKGSSEVKIFAAILIVAVVLVVVTVLPTLKSNNAPEGPKVSTVVPKLKKSDIVLSDSHVKGEPNAPNSLVVFSDFQCPMCKDVSPQLDKLVEKSGKKLNMVYHHFKPRPDHIHSQAMSRAAEAAGEQGKFWEMHDQLFKIQDLVKDEDDKKVDALIMQLAKDIKLDVFKFQASLKAKSADDHFLADNVLALQIKVHQTPTFYGIDSNGVVTEIPTFPDVQTWAKKQGIPN